jgi:hypothetical protein|tara:strand:+ start:249 stop:845 length:597 start_codon:yes stop_codon:yes gene_type:complete
MIFTEYLEKETEKYRKEWLNKLITNYRTRIKLHLGGEEDKDLEKEIQKKQSAIMNTEDTPNRFMMGILKVDIIAQALFEPNTRNVPKLNMLNKYLKDKGVVLDITPNKGQSSYFGPHSSIKGLGYKGYKIETAIWSKSSNDAGVYNKFRKIKNTKYPNPTILIADGPKIKQIYLDSIKEINNLQVMNTTEFIKWAKQN